MMRAEEANVYQYTIRGMEARKYDDA